jgi:hypothetical protein
MASSHLRSGGRYPVLRAIGIMYLIFGGLFAIGGLITALYMLFRGPGTFTDRFVEMCASLAGTAFLVLTTLAIAELLKLFMDVEHNTRMAWMTGANGSAAVTTTTAAPAVAVGSTAHVNRAALLEGEETAEGALLRGH